MNEVSVIGAGHYQLAWLIYLLAGTGFMLAAWQLLKLIRRDGIRWFLMSLLFFGIFTPAWGVVAEHRFVAPAILVAAFDFLDGLDKGVAFAVRAAMESLLLVLVLIFLSAAVIIVRHTLRRRHETA